MAFNKKELDQCFKSVTVEGFKFSKEIMGYSWTKECTDKTKQVIIGYAGYPDLYRIYTPVAEIYFNDVEEIITKFLEKHQIKGYHGNTTIRRSFVRLNNVDYSKFQLKINNEESFNTVAEEIKKVLSFGVMPFFENFHSLKTVWQETERMPIKEMANFIVQPLPQRRMVIKYLCNDPTYDSYVEWLIEYYKSEKDNGWIEIEKLDLFLKNSS